MPETCKVLFFLSIFLAISLSTCHIVKRKAPDGQLYIFSSREGCVSVQSEAPCRLTWQLNPYVAKVYKQNNEIVTATTQLYRSRPDVNNDCTQAVENVLCSQAVPKCSAADGSRDYGDVSKLCQDIYKSCPRSIVNNLKQNNFCQNLKAGKHPNSPCVAPSSPITGACPQAKYKMPSEFLADYRMKSEGFTKTFDNLLRLKYNNGERVFSSECVSLLEEIACSPLYCSVNETKLLIKHDRDDCNKIIKECFDDVLSRLATTSSLSSFVKATRRNLQATCDTYPTAATAQLMAEPPALKSFRTTPESFRATAKSLRAIPKSFRATPKSFRTVPQTTFAKKRARGIRNSASTCQFGHPIALVAIIASFILKLFV